MGSTIAAMRLSYAYHLIRQAISTVPLKISEGKAKPQDQLYRKQPTTAHCVPT
jgi:hypothetical protein